MGQSIMKWVLKTFGFLILCLAPTIALAQEDCPTIIKSALDATQQFCATIGRNQACYGNVNLNAVPQAGIDDDELIFEKPGDLVSVADVSSLTLSPRDADENTWGISLMKLQANLPATLPGQNVTFLLFGNVAIDNAVVSNTEGTSLVVTAQRDIGIYGAASADKAPVLMLAEGDTATAIGRTTDAAWLQVRLVDGGGWLLADSVTAEGSFAALDVVDPDNSLTPALTPMQAFYFQTGIADAPCAEAPDSGILVQTPGGSQKISFTADEVDITLGSTAYLQAQPSGDMTVSVVEGQAEVTAQGVTVTVPAGARVQIPLDANRAASGPPGAVTPYTGRDVQGLPIGLLERAITVAAPFVEGAEATAEAATNLTDTAPPISGHWEATVTSECQPDVTAVFPHDLTFSVDTATGALIGNWDHGRIGESFAPVEDGIYRDETDNEFVTITILSSNQFALVMNYKTPTDLGCTEHREDYVLVSAGG
jgi:hypothetical protein